MNKSSDTTIFASANMICCNWCIIKVLSIGTQMKVIFFNRNILRQ